MANKPQLDSPVKITIVGKTPSPDPASVPNGGELKFHSDSKYKIGWADENGKHGTFWSPQPPDVSSGDNSPQKTLPAAKGHKLKYTLDDERGAQGGGTVKVGS
jgi:hypothetical protein